VSYVLVVGGLVLLMVGGELLVRGAVRLAAGLGVSPLVVGLTVVGFGTSTPELVTSVQAAFSGTPGIAVGNIVGSNVANILLIVGLSALIFPIRVSSAALRRDGAVLLGAAVVFALLSAVGPLGRVVGLGFLLALVTYLVYIVHVERQAAPEAYGAVHDKALALEEVDAGVVPPARDRARSVVSVTFCLAGLVLLVAGGSLLVSGAVALARQMGVSDAIIGLTIVAVGTSLPELITSLVAASRKHADVAFGNIVGSNIYNILGIGGVTALLAPITVPAQIVSFDNVVMVAASIVLMLCSWTGLRIGRREGAMLLAGYVLYVFVLWP
jgi:cation:H+ antiporter